MGNRSLNPSVPNEEAAAVNVLSAKASLVAAAGELPVKHPAQGPIIEALMHVEEASSKLP